MRMFFFFQNRWYYLVAVVSVGWAPSDFCMAWCCCRGSKVRIKKQNGILGFAEILTNPISKTKRGWKKRQQALSFKPLELCVLYSERGWSMIWIGEAGSWRRAIANTIRITCYLGVTMRTVWIGKLSHCTPTSFLAMLVLQSFGCLLLRSTK